jgi:2-polyprenyl-3-methyl-5-hydroxy-6-metoxy-1,4-benzoquinol methylase
MRVAAPELEAGDDRSVASFYRKRISDCTFLSDPGHYEYPRARWILKRVRGNRLLEVGSGNGGMTRLLAPKVEHLVALDVSATSLAEVTALGLTNVETVSTLVERYRPQAAFDCIVISEVLEHLRRPGEIVARCVDWLTPGGTLLVTTPNGHWESNEHLHTFRFDDFARILSNSGTEALSTSYLRDRQQRRRWLVGQARAARQATGTDDFHAYRKIAGRRRRGRQIAAKASSARVARAGVQPVPKSTGKPTSAPVDKPPVTPNHQRCN